MRHYQVRDVMTANPMTVPPATPLKNVADMLVRGRSASCRCSPRRWGMTLGAVSKTYLPAPA